MQEHLEVLYQHTRASANVNYPRICSEARHRCCDALQPLPRHGTFMENSTEATSSCAVADRWKVCQHSPQLSKTTMLRGQIAHQVDGQLRWLPELLHGRGFAEHCGLRPVVPLAAARGSCVLRLREVSTPVRHCGHALYVPAWPAALM